MLVNANKPERWKLDIAQSVDFYNDWFMQFAPKAYCETRASTTEQVISALKLTANLTNIEPALLQRNPSILPMLRMTTAPPIARDRLIGLEFSYGGTLTKPKLSRSIPTKLLYSTSKWTGFPIATGERTSNNRIKLSDLFEIKRGLATGANKFFILTPEQIANYQLPVEFFTPILPSPRYLTEEIVEADHLGNPVLSQQLFLLTCNLSEIEVQIKYPSLWHYLQTGVEAGIANRYLCRHRSPWYAQEERPAAPLLCTYMGRQSSRNNSPFRFILNRSRATAPNVYLMLYPKPILCRSLDNQPERIESIWQALGKIHPAALMNEGRLYGGGLHKIEPGELANTPADNLLTMLPELLDNHVKQLPLFE